MHRQRARPPPLLSHVFFLFFFPRCSFAALPPSSARQAAAAPIPANRKPLQLSGKDRHHPREGEASIGQNYRRLRCVTIPKWLRGLTRNQLRSRAQVRILLVTTFCRSAKQHKPKVKKDAATRDRTRDLQIFSLTLSQLSYRGYSDNEEREEACVNGHTFEKEQIFHVQRCGWRIFLLVAVLPSPLPPPPSPSSSFSRHLSLFQHAHCRRLVVIR